MLLFIRLSSLPSRPNHQPSSTTPEPQRPPPACAQDKTEHLAIMAMEAAAPRPRLTLSIVAALAAALLVLAHGHGAVTPPRAVARLGAAPAGGPAAFATVRPWVARLQALHDLSISLDDDGAAGGEQQQQQGGFAECWGAVMGLSSCYSEILLFFVNGESYIGPDCCVAIRGATRYCWPAMLASVGFTAEEADVLRGFCDGEEAPHHPLATPPPVPAPGRGSQAAVRE